ncbi:protein roadkill-like [Planococcus citri]|uniref:protein roadkill-like n=1 Tax=Planococcus citri TaxID=170843 RepID=UPI0031F76B66
MNPFYIIGMFFFASHSNGQTEHSNSTLIVNTDNENMIHFKTHMHVHEIKYTWVIENFNAHKALVHELSSPKLPALTTDRIAWDIRLHPSYWCWYPVKHCDILINIFISSESIVKEAVAEYNVSIINHKKEVLLHKHMKLKKRYPALTVSEFEDYETLCERNSFFKNHLLQNDTLTMVLHIKSFFEPSNNVFHPPKIPSPSPIPDTTIMKNDLSENLESMLENPKFADVVFVTNGNTYPAHKIILAERSPVFAAMFQRDERTKNARSKKLRVNFGHMNEQVLRAMLRYIYTGKCENLAKLADKLLAAAIKYRLDGLRRICEQSLRQTSPSETAA